MKKKIVLVFLVCMVLTACGNKEESDREVNASEEKAIVETVQEEAEPKEADAVFVLYTEDGQSSVSIRIPWGCEVLKETSDTWLYYQRVGENGQDGTQFVMCLKSDDAASVSEAARQEVQYMFSANSNGQGTMDEIQNREDSGGQVSYFHYAMETLEGYRIWTSLGNGCVLMCTSENLGENPQPIDVDTVISEIILAIQE